MNTGIPQAISAYAPVRVCDVGGWTDTWFARTGYVTSIAINRLVHVTIRTEPSVDTQIVFDVRNYQQILSLDEARLSHPLLAVATDEIPLPKGHAYTITIDADMPPGSSTGTSAAVSVALLAALSACNNTVRSANELALRAHRLETFHLGQQSGVQDQIGAAYGGANFITITDYPSTTVEHIHLNHAFIAAFNQQHTLFYYGTPHRSSDIHQQVIARITREQSSVLALEPMRIAATNAADALRHNDLRAFATQHIHNTEAQSQLHPELVSHTAKHIIEIAKQHDAWGWKVNGAGGDGGSISVIASDNPTKRLMMQMQIVNELPHIVRIDSGFCPHGVQVTIDTN
ncbi:MAG: GHMP kinase [Chloroflexota bacterium]|jgi:D-glycero-alpha-D-manno-heptose-7-phosphate kinase